MNIFKLIRYALGTWITPEYWLCDECKKIEFKDIGVCCDECNTGIMYHKDELFLMEED